MSNIQLKKRIIIEGILNAKTPFRIGATEISEATSENQVLLINTADGNRVPIISATTLKGLFRSEFERLCNGNNRCHKDTPMAALRNDKGEIIHSCPVCELFGSLIKRGKIKFYDAYFLEKIEDTSTITSKKTRIGINRKSKTTLKGQLAFIRISNPKQKFRFKMLIENLDEESDSFKIICFIVSELMNGNIKIGGMKSAGLGTFTLNELKIKIYDFENTKNLNMNPLIIEFKDYYKQYFEEPA